MSKFKVGDKVSARWWRGDVATVAEEIELYVANLGGSFNSRYAYKLEYPGSKTALYLEDDLVSAPTKKRYEIIRVVEAESEEQALSIWRGDKWAEGAQVSAREIK